MQEKRAEGGYGSMQQTISQGSFLLVGIASTQVTTI
jgi:hypothetical protein